MVYSNARTSRNNENMHYEKYHRNRKVSFQKQGAIFFSFENEVHSMTTFWKSYPLMQIFYHGYFYGASKVWLYIRILSQQPINKVPALPALCLLFPLLSYRYCFFSHNGLAICTGTLCNRTVWLNIHILQLVSFLL